MADRIVDLEPAGVRVELVSHLTLVRGGTYLLTVLGPNNVHVSETAAPLADDADNPAPRRVLVPAGRVGLHALELTAPTGTGAVYAWSPLGGQLVI